MTACKPRVCKDCLPGSRRKAPHPGPRCATHHRAVRTARRDAAHDRYVLETYGITGEQYQAIYEAQGGRCAWCRRATGATRRLAVDHDHGCCSGPKSCRNCVRGLLCLLCNRALGHFRDDPEAIRRGADYLENPPARAVLGIGVDIERN